MPMQFQQKLVVRTSFATIKFEISKSNSTQTHRSGKRSIDMAPYVLSENPIRRYMFLGLSDERHDRDR